MERDRIAKRVFVGECLGSHSVCSLPKVDQINALSKLALVNPLVI